MITSALQNYLDVHITQILYHPTESTNIKAQVLKMEPFILDSLCKYATINSIALQSSGRDARLSMSFYTNMAVKDRAATMLDYVASDEK